MSIHEDASTWRRRTAGGIPYKHKTLEGEYAQVGSSATETYILRASDLQAFAEESFPFTTAIGGLMLFGIERPLPNSTCLFTKRIRYKGLTDGKPIDPFGADSSAPNGTYEEFVEVTVDYEQSSKEVEPNQEDPITFLEISSSASTNFLANTEGSSGATWYGPYGNSPSNNTSAVNINIPATVVEPSIEWSFRWPSVPYEYFSNTLISRLRSYLGKVNSGPTALFHNSPAETILFLGYSINQSLTWRKSTGVTVPPLSVDFKFLEKSFISEEGVQVTHNHMFRSGVGWRRLLVNGSPLFSTAMLDNVFR